MRQITHGFSLLVVVSQEFDAQIYQSFNLCDALQRVTSVVKLARFNCYFRYRVLQFYIFYLLLDILQTYQRFIRVHSRVHVFIPGQRVLRQSTYLSCACQRLLYQGWQAMHALLPYILLPPSGASGIFPLGCFFYTFYSNTLVFQGKLEYYAPLLRVIPLVFGVRRFPEKASKLFEIFLIVLPMFYKRVIQRFR